MHFHQDGQDEPMEDDWRGGLSAELAHDLIDQVNEELSGSRGEPGTPEHEAWLAACDTLLKSKVKLWQDRKAALAKLPRYKPARVSDNAVSADGAAESDSGHFDEPAAHSAAQITPAQLEVEIRERLAILIALNIKAQERLTGVAHDDARRDMLRAESDALACLRTLTLGAAHAVDDTDDQPGGKCE